VTTTARTRSSCSISFIAASIAATNAELRTLR
jgi:hypothetical protein